MVMSWIFTIMIALSILGAVITGNAGPLAASVQQGAQSGIQLAISIAGSICLWTGVGKVMEKIGLTEKLSRLLRPVLYRLFPSSRTDSQLRSSLSANICANFLGLGNAATPMGILATQRFAKYSKPGVASDEMCRLIVLNTASIQLIPATVAAVRSSLGCTSPFNILPAVWVTSLCSVSAGLTAALLLRRCAKP